MARPKGSKNKPKVKSPPIASATPRTTPEPIAPVDAPTLTAEPTFDPVAFSGGYETAVGERPPEPDPATQNTSQDTPEPARRRGRPPGARVNVSGMEQLLFGIHTTLFKATGVPEFEISQDEAHAIAEAYAEVCKHYEVFNIDPKHAAIVNFGSTVSIVYGSRFISWRARQTPRRARPTPQPEQQTAPFVPPQPVTAEQVNGIPIDPRTAPPPKPTAEIRTGEIPGVGSIVFGEDHPLVSGTKQ